MTAAEYWQLTIDCRDPGPLVAFWAAALGYVTAPPPEGFESWNAWYLSVGVPADELDLDDPMGGADRLVDPTGRGPRIWFQPVPESKTIKNRLHLDLYAIERTRPYAERKAVNSAWVEELVALGATVNYVTDLPEHERYAVTLQDPEGNEFCVG
ncbi:MAG TPA: VOC family protein [Marmoricola sp.]|nr:VOC family protein [Marmoricola sp.]